LPTLLAAMIIISIVTVTAYQKALFIHETGNIKIFGSLGIVLAIGLVLKWKYVRVILMAALMLLIWSMILILFFTDSEFMVSFGILLIAMVVAFYLITFSPSIKSYYNKK
jgi:hypothetical protein